LLIFWLLMVCFHADPVSSRRLSTAWGISVVRFQCFRVGQQQVRWRLLGSNNRVLGVSLQPTPDHMSALAEVETVRKYAMETGFQLLRVASGLWSWQMTFPATLTTDSAPVATSSRNFPRQVDARLAAQRFKQRVQEAEVDRTLAVFNPGRRGRTIPLPPGSDHETGEEGQDWSYCQYLWIKIVKRPLK
jgi:hypothetical protein